MIGGIRGQTGLRGYFCEVVKQLLHLRRQSFHILEPGLEPLGKPIEMEVAGSN